MLTASLVGIKRPKSNPSLFYGAALIVGVVTAALIIYPIVRVFVVLASETNEGVIARTLALPGLAQTLVNTLIVVVFGGILALTVGFALAWVNERTDARMGWFTDLLPVVPLLVPPVAAAIGWVFLLSPETGIVNVAVRSMLNFGSDSGPIDIFSWPGLLFLYTVELTPLVYLVISAALRNLDSNLEQASRMSGAGPLRTLWSVTIPAMKPALAAAAWLSVTVSLVIFSAPAIIGTPAGISVLSTQIVELLFATYPAETSIAALLGVFMLACIGLAGVGRWAIVRSGHFATVGGKGVRAGTIALGPWKWVARILMLSFLAVATILPAAGLAIISIQKYWSTNYSLDRLSGAAWSSLFANGSAQDAIWNSLRLGAVGALIALVLALTVTLLKHKAPGRAPRVLGSVIKLPAGFSHIIIALGVLLGFAGPPFALAGTIAILMIAYVIIYLPQASIVADGAVLQVDQQLIEASHSCGAGGARTARAITFPLVFPALAGGWVLLFIYMAGDLTASILLAGTSTPTAGYLIYVKFINGTYPEIAAFGLLISAAFTLVVFFSLYITQRSRFR